MSKRWIENEEQKQRAEKVLSMLLHKIKKGTATDEDRARYEKGVGDLVIYDWGTDSYQNLIPNMQAARREREEAKATVTTKPKKLIARVGAPKPKEVALPVRPPLTRRTAV